MNISFYCNANENSGYGHFSRSFVLAKQIRLLCPTAAVRFVGDYFPFIAEKILLHGMQLDSNSDKATIAICDDYQFTEDLLAQIKDCCEKLVVFDDFNQYNFPFVDATINFRHQAKQFCSPVNLGLLGLNFYPHPAGLTSIRLNNLAAFQLDRKTEHKQTLVLFIGGEDKFNLSKRLLLLIDKIIVGWTIIVVDRKNEHLEGRNNEVQHYQYVDDMSELYRQAGCVISGGGLTKYEAGYCMLPNACISQNEGQLVDSQILANDNLTFDMGLVTALCDDQLHQQLASFLSQRNWRAQRMAMAEHYVTNSCEQLAVKVLEV